MPIRRLTHFGHASVLVMGQMPALAVPTTPLVAQPAAMLASWSGPYGGVPPWDRVDPSAFPAAIEAAMNEQRARVKRITGNPHAPTFANTIAALERSGRTLERVAALFQVHAGTLRVGVMPRIEREVRPRLAGFSDEITQNAALFGRIEAVYQGRAHARLTPEQNRLVEHYHTRFNRAGARLDPQGKERVRALNQRLASLYTRFSQNVAEEESCRFTVIGQEADLAGMAPSFRDSAARAAEAKGLKGQWVIANTRSAVEPFLASAENRALREQVWRTYVSRCDQGGDCDNNALIPEILKCRWERARLLGYADYAHWALEPTMARTPERAMALMEAMWKPAVAQVRAEVAEMQALADREGAGCRIAPWDYRFYMEKLRQARYALDLNEVQPYLQLDKLREGMFWAAGQLYGFTFTRVPGLPLQHPDVSVWAVHDAKGRPAGLWYFDPFARPGKNSGAWMNNYRRQETLDGAVLPIVSNNANFMKGAPGAPVLISWENAVTLFHEFGHALHGLTSGAKYPSLSGTAVPADFVEFPAQLNERWLQTPELLGRFALHYRTGQPIPPELVARIRRAETFNQGFQTLEYLASAIIDMKLHLAGDQVTDAAAFERTELARLGMPEELVMRHRPTQFNHIFSCDSYAAGYYAYLWADALTADVWEAFQQAGGPWDKAVAEKFRRAVLAVGNTRDPAESFRAFRGRGVDTGALMRKRGFPPATYALAQVLSN